MHGFDHQCILARVPECPVWHLVDVGFGANCPVQPVPLEAPDTDAFTGEKLRRFHPSVDFGPSLPYSIPPLEASEIVPFTQRARSRHMKGASAVHSASVHTLSASCFL